MVATLLFSMSWRAMPDDGLISLAYARNVAVDGCWCLTSGVPANTATSPLNVWLLAIGTFITNGRALVAAGMLLVVTLAGVTVMLRRLGGPVPAALGPLLLAVSPTLNSAVGLETYLAAGALVAVVAAGTAQRTWWAAVACGAAALTRPDLAVAAAAALLVLGWGLRWTGAALAVGGGAGIALVWHLGAWWALGSAVPATLPVKAEQPGWGSDGSIHLANSIPMYLHSWPAATWLTLATLAAGVLAATIAADRRWWAPLALAVAGVVDLVAMAATAGAPGAYYVGPAAAGLGLAAVLVGARARWTLPAVVVLIAAALAFTVVRLPSWEAGFAPLRQNWATSEEYQRIAADLPTDGVVLSSGEIGALAFYCADRCTVVDPWLSDPGRTEKFVRAYREAHPAVDGNWTHHESTAPLQARYRLDYGSGVPAGSLAAWEITGSSRTTRWAVLRPI